MQMDSGTEMPLSSIRVIDTSQFLAGPYCGSVLADMGADVIRVEPLAGSADRGIPPLGPDSDGAFYLQANRNKRSLALDINSIVGREVFERLVASADIVITNLPFEELRRRRLDYTTLKECKQDIITSNVSAFGATSAMRDRVGFDGIGQAMNGSAYLSGSENEPRRSASSYVDYGTGLAATVGILSALLHRQITGKGQDVQTALLQTALTFTNAFVIEEAILALGRSPFGNRSPNSAPSDIYRTLDGHIMVQVIGPKMFARWATLVGRPELVKCGNLTNDCERGRNGEMLSQIMNDWTSGRSTVEAMEKLASVCIPAGPVYSPRQILEDEQIATGGYYNWVAHPGLRDLVPLAGPIAQLSGLEKSIPRTAPFLGQHSHVVLDELGYSSTEIRALERDGILYNASRLACE